MVLYIAVKCYTLLYMVFTSPQCYTLHYSVVNCYTVFYTNVQCCTLPYSFIHSFKVFYIAFKCCTLLYRVVQRCTVLYSVVHLYVSPSITILYILILRFPNLSVAIITRESCRQAFRGGITANQIIRYNTANCSLLLFSHSSLLSTLSSLLTSVLTPHRFLNQHAHGQSKVSGGPAIPPTISDQVKLWEQERDRFQFTEGVLYNQFLSQVQCSALCTVQCSSASCSAATFHIPAFSYTISYRSNRYNFLSVQYNFLSVQPI